MATIKERGIFLFRLLQMSTKCSELGKLELLTTMLSFRLKFQQSNSTLILLKNAEQWGACLITWIPTNANNVVKNSQEKQQEMSIKRITWHKGSKNSKIKRKENQSQICLWAERFGSMKMRTKVIQFFFILFSKTITTKKGFSALFAINKSNFASETINGCSSMPSESDLS